MLKMFEVYSNCLLKKSANFIFTKTVTWRVKKLSRKFANSQETPEVKSTCFPVSIANFSEQFL